MRGVFGRAPRWALALACLACSACALWVKFDGYDTSLDARRFTLRGTVDGLEGTATARVSFGAPTEAVSGNGDFELSGALSSGANYKFSVAAEGHDCKVQPSEVVVSGDVAVVVHCDSTDAALSDLTVGAPAVLAKTFTPETVRAGFLVPLLNPAATAPLALSATPRSPSARMTVDDVSLVRSMPTTFIPQKGARITVTAKSGAVRVYSIALDPEQFLKPADPTAAASSRVGGQAFGQSIAMDGDTLVVGMPGEDGQAGDVTVPRAGAAYVYRRSGATWSLDGMLKASTPMSDARFGASVAISGDAIAVGARVDPSLPSAYLFRRVGAQAWSEQAQIPSTGALGGISTVAISGDTAAVGIPFAYISAGGDSGASETTGGAFVFRRTGTAWLAESSLYAVNPGEGAQFGAALSLDGDALVVGAPGESSASLGINGDSTTTSAPSSGAAYVFRRSGTTWSQEAYVKASNSRPIALFGTSIALHGDAFAVGAPWESSGVIADQSDGRAPHAGAAYVFRKLASGWTQEAYVKPSNTRASIEFGRAVALVENTLIVGASQEDSSGFAIDGDPSGTSGFAGAGAAYVFRRSSNAWTQGEYLKAWNPSPRALFGCAVATDGTNIAVGASQDSSGLAGVVNPSEDVDGGASAPIAAFSGAVHVF